MEFQLCPFCGQALKQSANTRKTSALCEHCRWTHYRNPTVGIWFWGTVIGGKLHAGSDAAEVQFFALDDLPSALAFPTDRLICEKLKRCLVSGHLSVWLNSCLARR